MVSFNVTRLARHPALTHAAHARVDTCPAQPSTNGAPLFRCSASSSSAVADVFTTTARASCRSTHPCNFESGNTCPDSSTNPTRTCMERLLSEHSKTAVKAEHDVQHAPPGARNMQMCSTNKMSGTMRRRPCDRTTLHSSPRILPKPATSCLNALLSGWSQTTSALISWAFSGACRGLSATVTTAASSPPLEVGARAPSLSAPTVS